MRHGMYGFAKFFREGGITLIDAEGDKEVVGGGGSLSGRDKVLLCSFPEAEYG